MSGYVVVSLPTIIFIAGFGDNASMFKSLHDTDLAEEYHFLPINLPGFGAQALKVRTTLKELANFVAETAKGTDARIIVAHSVASIIASLAAKELDCPLTTIISLEGNITVEDAYFSGTAADYDDPYVFRSAFLRRLDEMAVSTPIIARYYKAIEQADPKALWQLGQDVRRFSNENVPGEVLASAGRVTYLYNPDNCPVDTLQWLETNQMELMILADASHWASVDQPKMLARKISQVLR